MTTWRVAMAGLLSLALATSGSAQRNRAVGGPGSNNAGFFVQELPAGFRIQGVNPPSWRVPGTGSPAYMPEGKIIRSPRAQQLADRLKNRREAQLARSARLRNRMLGTRQPAQTGAGWENVRNRSARTRGDRLTASGRVPASNLQESPESPAGMRSAQAPTTPSSPAEVPDSARSQYLTEWQADREQRRKEQQEVLQRMQARAQAREHTRSVAEHHASRRYGLSGGTAPSR